MTTAPTMYTMLFMSLSFGVNPHCAGACRRSRCGTAQS